MSWTVGSATEADVDSLTAAEPPSAGVAAAHFRRQLRGEILMLVVRDADGAPVGSAVLIPGDDAELRNVQVLPRHRGRGAGAALLRAAESEALARGARAIELGVADDNPRARSLYERHGYADTGARSTTTYDYVDDAGARRTATERDVRMRKPLR